MTARISTVEFLEPSGLPRRFFLQKVDALFAEAEFAWTLEVKEATPFPVEVAETLTTERRSELPTLPTLRRPQRPHPYFGLPTPETFP